MAMRIFTVASDSRLADLAVLLESADRVTQQSIHVIPFDDNIQLTRKLCALYGSILCEPREVWDSIGRHCFGVSAHQERGSDVQAWRYFRKFNAISASNGEPFVFVDANSALLYNPEDFFSSNHGQIIFGHFSKPRRNFSLFGQFLIKQIGPDRLRNKGYGAGFWFVPPNLLRTSMFEELLQYHDVTTLLGTAPEQSVLNLIIVLQGIKTTLVREFNQNFEYLMVSASSDQQETLIYKDEAWSRCQQDKEMSSQRLLAIKWTGNYHQGAFNFPQKEIHRLFVDGVLSRCSNSDTPLSNALIRLYSGVYGHKSI